ncbi:MinD/ParA family protein [Intrasporangium calvum]|uniref:MinD/ParA family protein n=1 Tax=Intrasporangium calvum TaxID=53358 RepID=A0ABT5GFH6_9MICO|nr:MinD/ParA family protein [Intrasporangium calvum]MDC5696641.1 MinD/ParA family protein [Intrasporangium calvum]
MEPHALHDDHPEPNESTEPTPVAEVVPLHRATASDFSEAAVLGRRGQAARTGWRHLLTDLSGGRLRLPPSLSEMRRNQLNNRVRTPFEGTRRIVVMSRKGGVGKTTVTVGVGSTFASVRGDRVVAVDANPDAGNLAHRIAGDCQRTITDLLADSGRIRSFAHMRGYTSQCTESRLEVLASDDDARIAQALDRDAYCQVVSLLDHFYNLIMLDTGTGILDSANQGLINEADQLVLVVRPALDGAKAGAQTLDWLEEHGHEELVASAVVVVNGIERESDPIVQFTRKHFETRCRQVTTVPWDKALEAGGRTTLSGLQRGTRRAFLDVAAALADGFSEEPLAQGSRESATHGFRFGPLPTDAAAPEE